KVTARRHGLARTNIAPARLFELSRGGYVSNKVLMIGLDGATFSLLDPLIEQGVMPFLSSVLSKAVRADLMSTRHPLTPPAWTTMITGRSPTAHGIYDFMRPVLLP